jgi:hypothetical protein
MNRAEKVKLLSNLIEGKLSANTLKHLTQPKRVCGVLIYEGKDYEPKPADELKAMLFYADGRMENRQMTFERFNQFPDTVSSTLFLLPDNKRRTENSHSIPTNSLID